MPTRCGWAAITSPAISPRAADAAGHRRTDQDLSWRRHGHRGSTTARSSRPAMTGDWHHDRRTVTRAELIGVMRPRVEEILEEVRARLDAAGFDHLPSQRIVLTGGASQLPGLDGLASRILGNRCGWAAAARAGPAAGLIGPGLRPAWAVAVRRASAGRMVGFRDPADRYPARSREAGGAVVPRQLVDPRCSVQCGYDPFLTNGTAPYFAG
jgi:hypothetical protein